MHQHHRTGSIGVHFLALAANEVTRAPAYRHRGLCIEDPFFAQLTRQIRLATKGLDIILGYAEADPLEALKISELMINLRNCDGLLLMKALLSLPQRPTAVFASDDNMAVGALCAAFEMGVCVPLELSLVGFDDISLSTYLTPVLTTVRQPVEALSQQAVTLLEGII